MSALLEVAGLEKDFGGVRAADGLNLSLEAGEMLCLIGPNGCGKTTFFNLISGAVAADNGKLQFDGESLRGLEPYQIARLGILRKFQVPGIYPDLTVRENLLLAAGGRPDVVVTDLAELLGLARLSDRAEVQAGVLAHGEKQWLEIVMVLAGQPRLLLLDEPTNGMTAAETAATVALIKDLHQRYGCAFIVIEHDMGFVRELDCAVALMLQGRILRQGSFAELQDDPLVKEAYLGQA
ncbi:ATP-binding cassette domain-containing protein [Pelagibius litoralis]|uniref:ATP-binding cassette domain-containing protein n=1 Tax=Pelagibius litoralis TaxID=374515 RepID=A0A967C701_9PROT|nr:ATP-binding cassette domain-containing protein [Pelagibius litoralis]NIA67737.1 ATP-binding cassette domain-containing protein [Pelagibius litoralis]